MGMDLPRGAVRLDFGVASIPTSWVARSGVRVDEELPQGTVRIGQTHSQVLHRMMGGIQRAFMACEPGLR
ncbi:MAG: hypothetical protein JWN04_245 [Myxococcaceae bacterium]|nr:hypothetical protein [Myxococcaceae bacterium]